MITTAMSTRSADLPSTSAFLPRFVENAAASQ